MNSCFFWQTEVKLEAKTVGTAMDMLASQLWNNLFQVHHGKLLGVSHGIETTMKNDSSFFQACSCTPSVVRPLESVLWFGNSESALGTSVSTFLWQDFRGQGTPGSHAIEKLCTQLNDFASRSKAGKQKTARQIDRQMRAFFFLILQMSFKCWQF